jgi:hypothetical protein
MCHFYWRLMSVVLRMWHMCHAWHNVTLKSHMNTFQDRTTFVSLFKYCNIKREAWRWRYPVSEITILSRKICVAMSTVMQVLNSVNKLLYLWSESRTSSSLNVADCNFKNQTILRTTELQRDTKWLQRNKDKIPDNVDNELYFTL